MKLKDKVKRKKYRKPGIAVSLAHAGVEYPGSKTVKGLWNARMRRISAGGK